MGQLPMSIHSGLQKSSLVADRMSYSIDPLEEDTVLPSTPSTALRVDGGRDLTRVPRGVMLIDNWDILGDEDTKRIIANGGVLKRGTRYSLTCRDVERISSSRSFRFV